MDQTKDFRSNALFDVEHALNLYATSYCTLPARYIYEKEILKEYEEVIKSCHIYIIGYLPKVDIENIYQDKNDLIIEAKSLGKKHQLKFPIPSGLNFVDDGDLCFCEDEYGNRFFPSKKDISLALKQVSNETNFDIKYIGQAYGKDGSRNALDRLLKHETLQKISLKGVPKGYVLSLLLLEVIPANRLLTVMNPFAKNKDEDGSRINQGLVKLYNTTEQERISIYEAALIKYFSPEFNKEFKNSFPSTNLKILQDCYDKDFSGVSAEIMIDELPFYLCSESVNPSYYHGVNFNLHSDEERRIFFGH